jgi:hypothetical protein
MAPRVERRAARPDKARASAPYQLDAYVVHNEAFCPVLAEVALDVPADPVKFMEAASAAVDKCWGSLTASISIDDDTRKANPEAFERFVDSMRVGALGINQWGGMCVSFGQVMRVRAAWQALTGSASVCAQLVWGAFPGRHSPLDIQSGVGKLGNSFWCVACVRGRGHCVLVDASAVHSLKNPAKSVVRYPFMYPAMQKVPVRGEQEPGLCAVLRMMTKRHAGRRHCRAGPSHAPHLLRPEPERLHSWPPPHERDHRLLSTPAVDRLTCTRLIVLRLRKVKKERPTWHWARVQATEIALHGVCFKHIFMLCGSYDNWQR